MNSIVWDNLAVGNDPDDSQIFGNATITYCDIENGPSGDGNVDTIPGFVDAPNGDYHLEFDSAVLHLGEDTSTSQPNIPADDFNVDDRNGSTGPTPDGNRKDRIRGASGDSIYVDMGFSEVQGLCPGDCAHFDGQIGVNDPVKWAGEFGAGGSCDFDHDGEVDITDKAFIDQNWGSCSSGFSGGSGGGEAMMAGGDDASILALIQAFIESIGGINESTIPLLIAFLEHLDPGGQ